MADIDLATATVEFVALAIRQDGPDPDTGAPDQVPLAGVRVKLAPSPRKVEVAAAGGEPARTITLRDWVLETDEAGILSNPETPGVPIQIVASDAFPGVTIEWTSTISAPDTGVPDIVKRWLAPTGSTIDLTTVASVPPAPSPLPDYLAAVADARSARDVALSAAERADDSAYAAGVARTGAETASGIAVAARDEAVPAAASAVSARDLAIAARDATLAASTIVGAGRPDQPASMSAPVQALVAAATTGAIFRTTSLRAAVQGAMVWRKEGSAWECIEGRTDWITIPITAAGVTSIAPGVKIRRVGIRVEVIIDRLTFAEDFASGTEVIPIPAGFRSALASFMPKISYEGVGKNALVRSTAIVFYGAGQLSDFRTIYSWDTFPEQWPLTL